MGNEQSAPVEESNGFHVLRVNENSPAYEAGIQPFFDFILSINGIRLDKPGSELTDQLLANVGKEVTLMVYSSKDKMFGVKLTPNSQWSDSTQNGLIGCAIRFCTYAAASENVWHILDVAPNSPAATAGLQAHTDYVIGTMHRHLETQADFSRLMEEHQGVPVQLLVYNRHWDTCREVTIVPDKNWGGQGSLGCDVGYGPTQSCDNNEDGNAEAESATTNPQPDTIADHGVAGL
ncbi:GRASP55/65 PDZ-like domain-containing protein [Syncephalis plumigaleata]|nr:GRASP55/65 PDZ-like domain-containing protein [Syncephalis plumigaleata]